MSPITPLRLIGLLLLCLASLPLHAQWNTDKTQNNIVVVNQGDQYTSVSCTDGAGGTLVAWYDNRGIANNPLHDVYVQRMGGNGQVLWTAGGVGMGVQTSGYGDLDIEPDGAGGAVVAFIVGSGSTLNIYAQRIDANGNKLWNNGTPVVVCNATDAQSNPRIARVDIGFIIVWEDKRSGSAKDIYAQQLNMAGVAQWAANGVVANAAASDQTSPQVIGLPNNECIITWDDIRNGSHYDIYAQRLNASGVRYWRGTDNLLSGRIISTAAANQRYPKMCTDGYTGAIIAWQDFRDGGTNSTDIYAQRIDTSGTVKWTANGVPLSTTVSVQNIEDIAYTGDGAAVCWVNFPISGDVASYDIHAQKVDSLGAVKWGTHGIAVCDAPQLQNIPAAATDGSGGAFFTWIDRREGLASPFAIYAQRILANGSTAWTANGVVVCNNSTTFRTNPQLVSNGCEVIVIWDDDRNSCCGLTDTDIFASKLNCAGNIASSAVSITWLGSLSGDWTNPANWSGNAVPTANDEVVIPSGTTHPPTVNNGVNAVCKTLRLSTGATVVVSTGGNLKVMQ
jgi:hypothetical protein